MNPLAPIVRGFAPLLIAVVSAAAMADEPSDPDPALRRTAHLESPDSIGVGRMLPDLTLTALDNTQSSLAAIAKSKQATVLCATSSTCPMCTRYAPKIAALTQEYANRNVQFIFINVSDTDSQLDMREQASRLGFTGLYLPDASRLLRATLGFRTTTEVIVIDAARTVVYRGAIDDQYGVGTALPSARSPWLRHALEATLNDQRVGAAASWAPGCIVEPPANVTVPSVPVTYQNRISRIMQARCIDCHRRGGAGPFRLDTYDDVAGRASMIKALLHDHLMPPWHASPVPDGELSPWANDRSLPPNERADLVEWLSSDRVLGDNADAPLVRRYPGMWTIGQPGLTLTTPTMSVPADGALRYSAIVLNTNLLEDRWVSAIEVMPMGHGIFHHALIYLLPEDSSATQPADVFRDLVAQVGMGDRLIEFPAGAALRLPAHARLLVHAYYMSGQKNASERVSIGFKFADEPPLAEVQIIAPPIDDLTIPAGAADQRVVATMTLASDTLITALSPALRARGKAVRYEAHLPDNTTRVLLDIPAYDYKWRERYVPRDPMRLPAGTRIQVHAVYDNSGANPNNPQPGNDVKWGWGVDHEILLGYIETLHAREP